MLTAAIHHHNAPMKLLAIVQCDHLNILARSAGSRKGRPEHAIVCRHGEPVEWNAKDGVPTNAQSSPVVAAFTHEG